ncbi:UNVERIFIED_CONTAM: hypothetical protein FKN15_061772 [Acipenser sinensis]
MGWENYPDLQFSRAAVGNCSAEGAFYIWEKTGGQITDKWVAKMTFKLCI